MNKRPEQLLEQAQRLTDQASELWNAGSYPRTETLCRRALKLTRSAVGSRDPLVAVRLYNLATLYHFQRRFAEAKPLYQEAILIHEAQEPIDCQPLAFCYAWLAKTVFEAWRDDPGIDDGEHDRSFREAESSYRKAIGLLERADLAETPEYSGCLMQTGFLFYYQDRLVEAEPLFCKALALREKLFGADHLETAEAIGRLAILYWHYDSADIDPEPLLRRSLSIREAQLEPSDPEVWEWTYRLAEFCRARGRNQEAAALFARVSAQLLDEESPLHDDVDWIVSGCLDYLNLVGDTRRAAAIEIRWNGESANVRLKRQELKRTEMMFGPDDWRVADRLCALADDLRFDEQYDEALALYHRALAIREAADGTDAARLLPILNGLAMLLRAEDELDEARRILERAQAIPYTEDAPEERTQHANALEQLAWVCAAQGSCDQAEVLFDSALALVETEGASSHREAAEMRFRRSIYYAQEQRYEEAETDIVRALREAEEAADLDALEIADYREHYASLLSRAGRSGEAASQFAEVKRLWEESGGTRDDL